jgi:hypothetical protein
VDGMPIVPVQVCQGSYAPVQAIGVARHAGCWYGSAPAPPARRGYGYGSGSAVVDGMPIVPVQVCQGSYAPPCPPGVGTANWALVRTASLPPARRGYGYVAGMPVVRGTAGVPVQVCQGSYAPPCPPGVGTACRAMVQPCPVRPAASRFLSNKRNRRFTGRRVVWRRDRAGKWRLPRFVK